jgi:hypothetical protein
VLEHLPSKSKALSLNPVTNILKKKKKKPNSLKTRLRRSKYQKQICPEKSEI